MKLTRITLRVLLIVVPFTLPPFVSAQRLYDAKRDEQAQAALKIVTNLQSGTLFDKQLKNLALLAKRDVEASLAAGRARSRSDINSFTTWRDVNCVVGRVNESISQVDDNSDFITKLAALKQQIADAKSSFAALKRTTECKLAAGSDNIDIEKCPELKPGRFEAFFEHVGDLEDIEEAVSLFDNSHGKNKAVNGALEMATGIVAALKTLYDNYKARMDDYNNLKGELLSIQLQLKKVALDALQVEEQRLKNIVKIRARREAEEAAIIEMIDDYEAYSDEYGLGFSRKDPPPCKSDDVDNSGSNIEMQLRDLVARARVAELNLDAAQQDLAQQTSSTDISDRRRRVEGLTKPVLTLRGELKDKILALHIAAAISSRGEIPRKLAALREAREEHAYSIRKSGVMARAYQLTVSGGVKRLALYHKGGIKPSKIAELVHTAATVAIPFVIASN